MSMGILPRQFPHAAATGALSPSVTGHLSGMISGQECPMGISPGSMESPIHLFIGFAENSGFLIGNDLKPYMVRLYD